MLKITRYSNSEIIRAKKSAHFQGIFSIERRFHDVILTPVWEKKISLLFVGVVYEIATFGC